MSNASTMTKSAGTSKTFFCVWPSHVIHLGQPELFVTPSGERGTYKRSQRVKFENQRFTTSDPTLIAELEAECRRQPMVLSTKWIPNPVLSKKDDLRTPGPDDDITPYSAPIRRSAAATSEV